MTAETYTYLKPVLANIPSVLADSKRWTVWKPIKRPEGKKPGKMPMCSRENPNTGTLEPLSASLDDPSTWMTLEEAKAMMKTSAVYKGVQYVLPYTNEVETTENKIIGVDLDEVMGRDGVTIKKEIQDIIESFNSYTELSPSGKGIRIFCYGSFPINGLVHCGYFEIYQCDKLLTVTGHHLVNTPETVEYAQKAIDDLREKHFKKEALVDEADLPVTPVDFTNEEILSKLSTYKLSSQFKKLFEMGASEGDDYSGLEKDMCKLICFFTQKAEQIDAIYRMSALSRGKWDDRRGDSTYGKNTIQFVLRTRKVVYSPTSSTYSSEKVESFKVNMFPFTVKDGEDKGIYKEVQMKGTDETISVQISSTPCVIVAIGDNLDTGEILYQLKIKDVRGHVRYTWKSTGDLLRKAEILKLHDEGLHFKESNATSLIDFFDKFINTYSGNLRSDYAASVGGWKKGFTMYVIGNRAVTSDGVQEILQLDTQFSQNYGCAGTIEGWAKSANYIAKYPAVRYKMYVSCVPALLRMLKQTSYVLDHHARSGLMKSISNWLAASIHGNPTGQQAGGDSTTVGIMGLVEYCIDIPTFLDETSQNIEAARKLGYRIGNVGSRLKGSQNGSGHIQSSAITTTVLLATGEHPMIPDNANGGEEVRVKSLTEGVSVRLNETDTSEMEMLMQDNYGHVIILFIQEVFKHKEQLKDIYQGMLAGFPSVDDMEEDSKISASRVKKQYAAEATAGFLLEKVFARIGVEAMNPLDVCKRYYSMNVVDHGFTPDYIKALEVAYKFYVTNEVYFQENSEINHTQYGWVKEEKATKHPLICFDEGQLKKQIIKELGPNRYESAVSMWKTNEILNTRTVPNKDKSVRVLHTKQIRVNGQNTTVIQIPLRNFYKFLNITEEVKEENADTVPDDDIDEPEYEIPESVSHSVNVPVSSGVTANLGTDIIVPDSSANLHDLLIGSLTGYGI